MTHSYYKQNTALCSCANYNCEQQIRTIYIKTEYETDPTAKYDNKATSVKSSKTKCLETVFRGWKIAASWKLGLNYQSRSQQKNATETSVSQKQCVARSSKLQNVHGARNVYIVQVYKWPKWSGKGCTEWPHVTDRQTDGQMPHTSVTIVCISCIRRSLDKVAMSTE